MAAWQVVSQLQNRARRWSASGRLLIIPAVLVALTFSLLAGVTAYLTSGPLAVTDGSNWFLFSLEILPVVGAPLGLWLVWRYSKPVRRVVWVYDWLGGGLLCIAAAWLGHIVLGLLQVDGPESHLHLMTTIVTITWSSVGVVLLIAGTANLSAELRSERQERQRLESLMEFTRRITSLDYQTTLNETVRHLQLLLRADAVVLFLWEEVQQSLVAVAGYHDRRVYTEDYVQRMMSFKCPKGFGVTGWVMESGEPYIAGDVRGDPRSQAVPGYGQGEKSSLLAPLQVEGRRLGVVRLTRKGLNQFSQDDLDLVLSFAAQASMVLEYGRIVKELSELSITDPLTDLFNARHFHQVLEVEVRRARRYEQPLSLIMTDSDSLKKVNDLLGHQRGDEHLRTIARVLKATVRVTDYAFRYAGDEFLVLLPNTPPAEVLRVAERIRRQIEEKEVAEGVTGTVSIGVAALPDHAVEAESLLAAADWAMYESKRAGKNRVTLAHETWLAQRS